MFSMARSSTVLSSMKSWFLEEQGLVVSGSLFGHRAPGNALPLALFAGVGAPSPG
jgi:hypothetical protein